jgi:hypothetical protein
MCLNVDEANVDTYSFVESFSQWKKLEEVSHCKSRPKNMKSELRKVLI